MTSTPELRSTFVSQKVTDKIAALPDNQPYYTFEVSPVGSAKRLNSLT
jgi:hypothetical protein